MKADMRTHHGVRILFGILNQGLSSFLQCSEMALEVIKFGIGRLCNVGSKTERRMPCGVNRYSYPERNVLTFGHSNLAGHREGRPVGCMWIRNGCSDFEIAAYRASAFPIPFMLAVCGHKGKRGRSRSGELVFPRFLDTYLTSHSPERVARLGQ